MCRAYGRRASCSAGAATDVGVGPGGWLAFLGLGDNAHAIHGAYVIVLAPATPTTVTATP